MVSDNPRGATPGRHGERSLLEAPPLGSVSVSPNPFSPWSGDHLLVAITPAPDIARVIVTAFNMSGRSVADLGSAAAFPAVVAWNGVDRSGQLLLPGLYVVAVEYFGDDERRVGVEKVVVGCAAAPD